MRLIGFLLLLAGWVLVLAAVVLLGAAPARAAFVLAGTGVEALGLALVFRSHLVLRGSRD
jgi:NaMN:DMB phosphoribosyltransferase